MSPVLTIRVKQKADLMRRLRKVVGGDYSDFLRPAAEMIRDDIIMNIKHQVTPEGTALKKNAPSTLEYKRKYGWGSLSLIAKFRMLISEGTYLISATANRAVITLAEARKKVGVYLEARGYHFWGISQTVKKKILDGWRAYIRQGMK